MRFDPMWPNNKVDRLPPRQRFLANLGMGVVGGVLVTWFQWYLNRNTPGAVTWGLVGFRPVGGHQHWCWLPGISTQGPEGLAAA